MFRSLLLHKWLPTPPTLPKPLYPPDYLLSLFFLPSARLRTDLSPLPCIKLSSLHLKVHARAPNLRKNDDVTSYAMDDEYKRCFLETRTFPQAVDERRSYLLNVAYFLLGIFCFGLSHNALTLFVHLYDVIALRIPSCFVPAMPLRYTRVTSGHFSLIFSSVFILSLLFFEHINRDVTLSQILFRLWF